MAGLYSDSPHPSPIVCTSSEHIWLAGARAFQLAVLAHDLLKSSGSGLIVM